MQFNIQNEFLSATITEKGAELQSLYGKQTGIEYMWNGDENYWAKHSPVLFPIVGTLKDNSCLLYTSPSPRDRTRSRMPSSA